MINNDKENCQSGNCGCGPAVPKLLELGASRRQFMVAASAVATSITASLGTGLGGPLLAASQQESYADVIKKDPALRGHWRFDGNLIDVMGKAPAKANGEVSYSEGVVEGKAISLVPNKPLSVDNTNHLRGRSATLELFFKIASAPTGDEDPVLIAQTDGQAARYIVGIKNDLSALLYQNVNADVVTTINLATNLPLEVGRWYHLVITSFDLDLRAYVDGYECSLLGGAFEFTRRGPGKSTMTFGATSVDGWGSTDICLDEVACYAKGLTQAEVQEHLKAAGWQQRLKETGEIVARVAAERDGQRARKRQAVMNDPALTARGETRVYENANLDAINFMVGGIGAGAIQFNGKAEPAIWQIACNYKEERITDSFLAVRAQTEGSEAVVRALQTESAGAFEAMPSLKFEGEYPFAKYRFQEPALPVNVELEVFNPFIPMDLKNSAIPCAIYTVTLTNNSPSKVNVDVLAAQKNALGYAEAKNAKAQGKRRKGKSKPAPVAKVAGFGKNQNRIVSQGDTTLLHMTRSGVAGSDMVLMTQASGASGTASWDSTDSLRSAVVENGALTGPEQSEVSPAGQTVNGAISAPLELAPGESKSVTFALTWYFKAGKHGSGRSPKALEGEGGGKSIGWGHSGQNYNNWWPDAMGVAKYLQDNLVDLIARTRQFHDTLYASTLPVWLLDRMSSQLAVLRSQTCWWAADGYFGAWEGSNPTAGCCGGNCTHVWHYAQAHARLLPELGRKMREQDYATQSPEGLTPYRHTAMRAAADGHFGTILNTYREHLCATDNDWLKSQWPKVKKAIDWGIEHWNPKRDGFLETIQHNTLDGDMTGCSSWIGSLYLTSLEASARMADIMGEADTAAAYRKIRESGKTIQNERLWNGEYYIQEVGEKRSQDYLDGCHIDQILGEWWADQVNIDRNYPEDRSRTAMESLLKHNFLADFHGQSLKPRQYCEIDDGGMKMITWPNDPQPIPGMKYGDEVMTGFEYGAAVSLMQNGLLNEGLMVIKAISDRYDGRLRTEGVTNMRNGPWGYSGNPFGDDECGKYYGRSLSVWSALLALQGFIYDGPAGRIGFKPCFNPEDHASFFSVAEGYGLFTQTQTANQMEASIELREGKLRLTEIVLAVPEGKQSKPAQAKLDGASMEIDFELLNGEVKIRPTSPITLEANQKIDLQVTFE